MMNVVIKDEVNIEYIGDGNYVVKLNYSWNQLSNKIRNAGGNPDEILEKLLQNRKVTCELA